jgi:hypothetical protein
MLKPQSCTWSFFNFIPLFTIGYPHSVLDNDFYMLLLHTFKSFLPLYYTLCMYSRQYVALYDREIVCSSPVNVWA